MRVSGFLLGLTILVTQPQAAAPLKPLSPPQSSAFVRALARAERALAGARLTEAREALRAALERDPKSMEVWRLQARLGKALNNPDEEAYALHRLLRLVVARGTKEERKAIQAQLFAVDPIAEGALSLLLKHQQQLAEIAQKYEKKKWPHAAIAVHKCILALDPENEPSRAAIEKLAAAPDPSLAEDARPPDLFADVSEEWIKEYDQKHSEWKERGKLQGENYATYTDAGYKIMVQAAEAMEQMNAFYRRFFQYGTEEDGRSVSRIDLKIFRDRDEYLKYGSSPAEWSGGQFTGGAVETFADNGFESMMGVLFHEAAHQFVSLATNSAGWLNEGLASFFEGCRILKNGTVEMNLPASHRLFPLVQRMKEGWMGDEDDGISNEDPNQTPSRAPTFRIVLENKYEWGPPWYAPTWGVVYFLYNYQDPADGRYVYRRAFREFINASGGKMGDTAVKNFEEVVLANPMEPTKGTKSSIELPRTVKQLDAVWKDWTIALSKQQSGATQTSRPYLEWAEYAILRGERSDAREHFEKGLRQTPDDAELLFAFGELLVSEKKTDRATKLFRRALREFQESGSKKGVDGTLAHLRRIDPNLRQLEKLETQLAADARATVASYIDRGLELVAMDLALRWGNDLDIPELFTEYERAMRKEGRSLAEWRLAYNEENLDGWISNPAFKASGPLIEGEGGKYSPNSFSYRFLGLDEITSGDFSFEAEVLAEHGNVAFAGLIFGRKSLDAFHALFLYPPGENRLGYVDLASFYSPNEFDTWRHNPVAKKDGRYGGEWYRLRIDITGNLVDVWVDDEFVTTQEFASRDVLRGSFGLIMGDGKVLFRNVRYLSRNPRDPSGIIDRKLRLGIDTTLATAEAGDDWEEQENPAPSSNGSWVGRRPAFPRVLRWVQDERRSWKEGASHPQLMVLWSCEQNDVIAVDGWLNDLARQYEEIGLLIVNVVSNDNSGQSSGKSVDEYLKSHPFPGSVGVDEWDDESGVGRTFRDYSVARFQLPRVLLLDVDGKVVWEGAPGFSKAIGWPQESSFLQKPLEDLIARRRLNELLPWLKRWQEQTGTTDAAMNFEELIPLLGEAKGFDGIFPTVREAQARLKDIESLLGDLEATTALVAQHGAEPSLDVLLEWSRLLGHDIQAGKETRRAQKGPNAQAWKRAQGMLKPMLRKIEKGKPPGSPARAIEKLQGIPGRFPALLVELMAAAANDPEELTELVQNAEQLPQVWLLTELLGWF
jgi:tetratricopeptide (TPR) repeat protein